MKYYVGLDVSLAETAICVLDVDGIIVREGTAPSHPDDIADWLDGLGLALKGWALKQVRQPRGSTMG